MYYIHLRWFCLHLNNFYSHRLRPNQSIKGLSFFSCGYWDVSLLRVCLYALCIQAQIGHTTWVSPFGNPGVKGYWRLTRAYRSLSRPSSPLIAKASTKHPLLLFIHAWRESLRALKKNLNEFLSISWFLLSIELSLSWLLFRKIFEITMFIESNNHISAKI